MGKLVKMGFRNAIASVLFLGLMFIMIGCSEGEGEVSVINPFENPYLERTPEELYTVGDTLCLPDCFPCERFLSEAVLWDPTHLQAELKKLDELKPMEKSPNRKALVNCMTVKLQEQYNGKALETDSLLWLLQAAEQFHYFGQGKGADAIVYRAIYDHWMNFIIEQVNLAYDKSNNVKYNNKFRYLVNRCQEKKYMSKIGNSNYEKALLYFSDSQFGYLLNRFWIATTLPFKLVVLAFILFTFYGYILIIGKHLIRGK